MRRRFVHATIPPVEADGETRVIYREEVLGILGALADLVVEVRRIRRLLEEDDGQEAEE